MYYSGREENKKLSISTKFIFLIIYVFFIFVLAYCIWPKYEASQFSMYQYKLVFNVGKLFFGIVLALLMSFTVHMRYTTDKSFSGRTLLLLSLLYFIPGVAISCALNVDWGYLASYILYYYIMVLADCIIGKPKKAPVKIKESQSALIFKIMVMVALLYPFVMIAVYNKSFSLSNFLLTISDPYGVRAQAREQSVSSAFLLVENWCVYFGALFITYSLKRKKFILAIVFIITEAFYFSLQGNRIFVFITGIAILLGFFKIKEKYLPYIFIGLLGIQIFEYLLFHNLYNVGFVMNVFRRFSMVPNIISTKYYYYFQTAVPDFLRGHFPNISRFLGTKSQYDFNVGYIIGQKYFGSNMNANTGLVGGAFFEFGLIGVVIDPIMLVFSLRIFEKVLFLADEEITMVTALIYAMLAINSWAVWSQLIRISFYPLLLISIYIMINRSSFEYEKKELLKKNRVFSFGDRRGNINKDT